MRRRSRTQECHFEKHRVPTMPYGPMGPPVARARPVRAHVAASEHARSLERGRAAAAFEERHVCSEGDQSRHAFRKPPPWAEDPQPSASRKASRTDVEKPALTHAQLDAALAVADALRADGLSLDAEKVLRTVLAVDPINARATNALAATLGNIGLGDVDGEARHTGGRGKAPARPDELGAYGLPKPKVDGKPKVDEKVKTKNENEFEVRLNLRYVNAQKVVTGVTPNTDDQAHRRWSHHERPLLFDRLPEPAPVKTLLKPPPKVTKAELDLELKAKQERVKKEKDSDRREAKDSDKRAAQEELRLQNQERERKTQQHNEHRDALRVKASLDTERFKLEKLRAECAEMAELGKLGTGFGDTGDGDDEKISKQAKPPPPRTGKRYAVQKRQPSPFATGLSF